MSQDFEKMEFDIIIQAGQSNAWGRGRGDVNDPFISNDKIWYLNNDLSISLAHEEINGAEIIGNFSLSFATEYISNRKLQGNRRLLILRSAVGGTGFLGNRWGMENDLFLKMMEMIRTAIALNPKNKLVALLWHQGEADAILNCSYETHYRNLSNLVTAVRTTFNCKDLPFIAGDFVNHWKNDNTEICEPVIKAIEAVCSNIGSAKFIATSELESNDQKIANGDPLHFCREATNQLGIKYFNAFHVITEKSF